MRIVISFWSPVLGVRMYMARRQEYAYALYMSPKNTKYNERVQRLCGDVVCAKFFMDLGKATITTVSDIK